MGFCNLSMFCYALPSVHSLDWEERAGYFALFIFLVYHECCVALPHDAMGLSAVWNYGIS